MGQLNANTGLDPGSCTKGHYFCNLFSKKSGKSCTHIHTYIENMIKC